MMDYLVETTPYDKRRGNFAITGVLPGNICDKCSLPEIGICAMGCDK